MSGLPYFLVGGTESTFGVQVCDIQDAFRTTIQSYLPQNPVVWVSLDQVRQCLGEEVEVAKKSMGGDVFIVTVSSLYYDKADAEISCTRVSDINHASIGISHRPHAQTLRLQVSAVMSQAGDRKIVVVDDTLFHGDTTKLLMKMGLRIDGVVEYFAAKDGIQELRSMGVLVWYVQELDDYLDVLPLHDFLPGMPLCGKLIGEHIDSNGAIAHHPYLNGLPWAVPYLYPYISPDKVAQWASIPWEYVHHFSAFALDQAGVLADRLSRHGIIALSDVAKCQRHHVSIPYLRHVAMNEADLTLRGVIRRAVHFCMA